MGNVIAGQNTGLYKQQTNMAPETNHLHNIAIISPFQLSMAIPQENTPDVDYIVDEYHHELEEGTDASFYCGWSSCFGRFCWSQRQIVSESAGSSRYHILIRGEDRQELITEQDHHRWPWLTEQVKKLKQISELVAGPRWKNFIRRFNKRRTKSMQQYHYDLQSYALNFDDGILSDNRGQVDCDSYPDFSTRFGAKLGFNNVESGHHESKLPAASGFLINH